MCYTIVTVRISIHAAREGGDVGVIIVFRIIYIISIHAAREGGDALRNCHRTLSQISIHAAREGGDG